jgi:hypothetical protein
VNRGEDGGAEERGAGDQKLRTEMRMHGRVSQSVWSLGARMQKVRRGGSQELPLISRDRYRFGPGDPAVIGICP